MAAAGSRVVLAGGSGLVGTACREVLSQQGFEVITLTRSASTDPQEVTWNPSRGTIGKNVLDGAVAVVHLCGIPLPKQRWTEAFKQKLLDSRVQPAEYLRQLINQCDNPPRCYIGMSAIGVYGDQGTAPVTESDEIHAEGFVPDFVRTWEQAHLDVGISRTVLLRAGVVISAEDGYLPRFVPPSYFGIYPYFGNGKQMLSWIHISDMARVISLSIRNENFSGVYHATAPEGIPQKEFARALRSVRRWPGVLFPVPQFLLRILFGEMSSILFESADVRPEKLQRAGFQFHAPNIREALRLELNAK